MTKENQDNGKREKELIDEMIARHGHRAAAILGLGRLVAQLTKRVVERALAGELTHPLGHAKGAEPQGGELSQRERRQGGVHVLT